MLKSINLALLYFLLIFHLDLGLINWASLNLEITSSVKKSLNVSKIFWNVGGWNIELKTIIIDLKMLIEFNSQNGFTLGREVSNLNSCKSTTWCCWLSTEHCSLTFRYRVFILLLSFLPFLNLSFGNFDGPIFKFKLALNFGHDSIFCFREQKDGL